MDSFLGIDLGTSSVKVIILDGTGAVRALRSRGYSIKQPSPGFAEQSPGDWWKAVRECIQGAVTADEARGCVIRSIGLSGQMHGLVLVDDRAEVLRDAIIWPDRRTTAICAQRAGSPRTETFRAITGLPLAAGFLAPSLEWVKRMEPDTYRKAAHFMLPKDYIRYRLTGRIASDPSDACGTYLFDIKERGWSGDLLDEFGIDGRLAPEIMETMAVAGELTGAAAAETGLPPGIPVITGGSDQAMAALALGADRPGVVAAAISTGGTVITTIDKPLYDRRVHTLCHAYKDRWLMMGATLSAGVALSWFAGSILAGDATGAAPDVDGLTHAAGEIPAGSEGLIFSPYLSGDRTPHMDPNAKGCFVGLTLSHTRAHMVRAIMEGVVYSLYDSVRVFAELGLPAQETFSYGGGSKSPAWRQIMADIFGCPIQWRRFSEYSVLGAAMAGAQACGVSIPREKCHGADGQTMHPLPQNVRIYQARRETFEKIYTQLRGVFGELSEFKS